MELLFKVVWLLGLALDHPDTPTAYLKVSADPGRLAGRPPAAVCAPTLSIIVLILALIALVAMASLPGYTTWGA